jgi:hypothetical protein
MLTLLVSMALAGSPGSTPHGAEGGPPPSATPPPVASSRAAGGGPRAPDSALPDRNTPLARALAHRDGVACAELPVAAASELVAWTNPDLGPPWAPLRAVACLAERFPETVGPLALGWVGDPTRQGLVLAVLQQEGRLPESVALELGRAAMADPTLRPRVARFLRKSDRPAIKALATTP